MKKSPAKPAPKKKPAAPVVVEPAALRPLGDIVTEIGKALTAIAGAEEQLQRATLADRIWIGVLCLGGQEHHAMPAAKRNPKGINQHSKEATSTRRSGQTTALAKVHPQGFLAWVAEHVEGTAQPTVYKYMAAARALGLDAWSTEHEVRTLIAERMREWDERHGKPLSLAALAAQGKALTQAEPTEKPEKPSIDKIKYDAIRSFTHQAEELIAVVDHFSPEDHEAVTNQLANTLQRITGFEWSPVTKD